MSMGTSTDKRYLLDNVDFSERYTRLRLYMITGRFGGGAIRRYTTAVSKLDGDPIA